MFKKIEHDVILYLFVVVPKYWNAFWFAVYPRKRQGEISIVIYGVEWVVSKGNISIQSFLNDRMKVEYCGEVKKGIYSY